MSVLFIGMSLSAQSAEVVTDILGSPKVTYGQACYLSAVAQDLVKEEASYEDAVVALFDIGQLKTSNMEADNEIRLDELAAVYTRIFNVKGGLMYRITKGSPRYALRLLKADGIVPQNSDPSSVLTGEAALSLFTSCLLQYGEEQFTDEL
mgnify:FL=1